MQLFDSEINDVSGCCCSEGEREMAIRPCSVELLLWISVAALCLIEDSEEHQLRRGITKDRDIKPDEAEEDKLSEYKDEGTHSKGHIQKDTSKGIHPKRYIQRDTSKGTHPKKNIQRETSKGTH